MGSPAPQAWGPDRSASQGGEVDYYVRFTSPGASSPTFPLAASNGITSVAYSATGILLITLANAFYQVLSVRTVVKQASYSANGACGARWTADSNTAGTVTVTLENAAGAAVAPASGDVIAIVVTVQNYKSQ